MLCLYSFETGQPGLCGIDSGIEGLLVAAGYLRLELRMNVGDRKFRRAVLSSVMVHTVSMLSAFRFAPASCAESASRAPGMGGGEQFLGIRPLALPRSGS